MEEERRSGVCSSPGGKLGFGRGNSTRGPAVICHGRYQQVHFTRVGALYRPSVLPTRGVSVLSGSSLEQTVTRSCSH